jgi:hypothetical protein
MWFKDRLIMGVAESGLTFYNIKAIADLTHYTWAESGFGNYTGALVASWPTLFVLSQLQKFIPEPYLIQALVFYLLLVVSGVSVYFLIRLLFPKITSQIVLLGVLFYWFNPLALVNIWGRFLVDFLFFYAFFPLALYIFLKGIKNKSYKYSIFLGIAGVVFSFSFSAMVTTVFLWGVLGLSSLFYFITNRKSRSFIIKFFLLTLGYFVLINSWWISQLIYLASSRDFVQAVSLFASTQGNLDSLKSLSGTLGTFSFLLRFLHSGVFNSGSGWTKIFVGPLAALIEFVITGIIFAGIIIYRKNKNVLYLSLLLLIGFFLAKGTSEPFGKIFEVLFSNIQPLQLFRNPFEKFSLLIILPSAILFPFSIDKFIFKTEKLRNIATFLIAIFFILFWGFPFISGKLFAYGEEWDKTELTTYDVDVPGYYKEASKWLTDQTGRFRFISLPLGDEGITYAWPHPYRGVELSYILFPVSSLSNNTTVLYFNSVVNNIEKDFLKNNDFWQIMNAVNAKYILLRNDVNWKVEKMRDPQILGDLLKEKDYLKKASEFGDLSFWENKNWEERFIFAENNFISSLPTSNIIDLNFAKHPDKTLVVSPLSENSSEVIIHPSYKFSFSGEFDTRYEMDPEIFPHVSTLASSRLYPAILLKERLISSSITNRLKKLEYEIALLGKRLVEAKISTDNNDPRTADVALSNYLFYLNEFKKSLDNSGLSANATQVWNQEKLANLFAKHSALVQSFSSASNSSEVLESIRNFLKTEKIMPNHDLINKPEFPLSRRAIYQFVIPRNDKYTLMLDLSDWNKYYSEKINMLQLDDKLIPVNIIPKNGYTSFGEFDLSSGTHELAFNAPAQINLVKTPLNITLSVDHGEKDIRYEIQNFDSYGDYEVSFNYFIKRGEGFEISVEADNDPVNKGRKVPSFDKIFSPDSYDFDIKSFKGGFRLSPDSTKADFVISARPANICKNMDWIRDKSKCDDPNFRYPYDKTTEVQITNIEIKKVLSQDLILKSSKDLTTGKLPELDYEKISSVAYKINVKNAQGPFMLVLSQLYNGGWKAKYSDSAIGDEKHYLINGFENGWYIERKGDYEVAIEYEPEIFLEKGKFVTITAIISGVVLLGVLAYIKRRKDYEN